MTFDYFSTYYLFCGISVSVQKNDKQSSVQFHNSIPWRKIGSIGITWREQKSIYVLVEEKIAQAKFVTFPKEDFYTTKRGNLARLDRPESGTIAKTMFKSSAAIYLNFF